MTRKQLAEELYDLNVKRGVLGSANGCGKDEWVRRTLNGIGANTPQNKQKLMRAVAFAKEDLKCRELR